ncbi:hypothetical protein PY093_15370 [Cytobacillus sp. S13-E01]|uniref:hypothetical protein n=1 Tax=Cytobacillus sp. S13-E01 TaxID=3031326 RepID=UPI0023D81F3C|nr:hypothetical protein [Cytobacillus sp. S13-E01]MDF0728051.1 hypothetical protein [Cytobacillus sp. S13-E01]
MIEEALKVLSEKIHLDKELFRTVQTGDDFEKIVLNKFQELITSKPELNIKNVEHNGSHSFPDLKVTFTNDSIYGVEIKFSASGNWKSKGNSVFESLSNKEQDDNAYKEIYVFFGRKPKLKEDLCSLEVKFAPYGSSVDKIEVTHSPRFAINMAKSKSNLSNLFGSDGTYAEFRIKSNQEKNDLLREYFSKNIEEGSSDKWYLPKISNEDIINVEPILFSTLSIPQQRRILAESFILYPKDLFGKQANYARVASHMISEHFVYGTSLRDCFSAGGKIIILEKEIKYPRILMTFYTLASTIKELLLNPPYGNFEEECFFIWEESFNDNPTIIIDKNSDLATTYQKIISNFKPCMAIQSVETDKKTDINIDLTKFYFHKEE